MDHQPGHLANPAAAPAALLATVVAGIAAGGTRAATIAIAAPLATATGAGNADFFAGATILMLGDLLRGAVNVADGDEAAAAVGAAIVAGIAGRFAATGHLATGRCVAGRWAAENSRGSLP